MHLIGPVQAQPEANPYRRYAHVGILFKDVDAAADLFRQIGFDVPPVRENNDATQRFYRNKHGYMPLRAVNTRNDGPGIELMEAGTAPSAWREYYEKHGEAVHHLGITVPDFEAEMAKWLKLGFTIVQEGYSPRGEGQGFSRFAYLQRGDGPVLELLGQSAEQPRLPR